MALHRLASIFMGVVYFFGGVCPKFEKTFNKIFKEDSKVEQNNDVNKGKSINKIFKEDSKVVQDNDVNKDKSIIKKFYGGARNCGDIGMGVLECGKEILINSYIMFGTPMDEEGNMKLWSWFDEVKKIHKGHKF